MDQLKRMSIAVTLDPANRDNFFELPNPKGELDTFIAYPKPFSGSSILAATKAMEAQFIAYCDGHPEGMDSRDEARRAKEILIENGIVGQPNRQGELIWPEITMIDREGFIAQLEAAIEILAKAKDGAKDVINITEYGKHKNPPSLPSSG